ncbi:MAG: glutamine-hydrolyzing GMP synthase, partial [Gemmatimonadota bacterium]
MTDRILIIDFGSQFTQLIARRIREERVYSEIHPPTKSLEWVRDWKPSGIILSGGPASVYDDGVPLADPALLALDVPILGICYGMQLLGQLAGARVVGSSHSEYGRAVLDIVEPDDLFAGFEPSAGTNVWMSHGDQLEASPPGWRVLARTATSPVAAFRSDEAELFGVQFHPEVAHTVDGERMLSNFLFRVCGCAGDWTPGSILEEQVEAVRQAAPEGDVICGLSGGVDSSVAAALVHRAVGDRL